MTDAIQEFKDWMYSLRIPKVTTIDIKCGLCNNEYEMEVQDGELKLLQCTECHNTTLQMVRG